MMIMRGVHWPLFLLACFFASVYAEHCHNVAELFKLVPLNADSWIVKGLCFFKFNYPSFGIFKALQQSAHYYTFNIAPFENHGLMLKVKKTGLDVFYGADKVFALAPGVNLADKEIKKGSIVFHLLSSVNGFGNLSLTAQTDNNEEVKIFINTTKLLIVRDKLSFCYFFANGLASIEPRLPDSDSLAPTAVEFSVRTDSKHVYKVVDKFPKKLLSNDFKAVGKRIFEHVPKDHLDSSEYAMQQLEQNNCIRLKLDKEDTIEFHVGKTLNDTKYTIKYDEMEFNVFLQNGWLHYQCSQNSAPMLMSKTEDIKCKGFNIKPSKINRLYVYEVKFAGEINMKFPDSKKSYSFSFNETAQMLHFKSIHAGVKLYNESLHLYTNYRRYVTISNKGDDGWEVETGLIYGGIKQIPKRTTRSITRNLAGMKHVSNEIYSKFNNLPLTAKKIENLKPEPKNLAESNADSSNASLKEKPKPLGISITTAKSSERPDVALTSNSTSISSQPSSNILPHSNKVVTSSPNSDSSAQEEENVTCPPGFTPTSDSADDEDIPLGIELPALEFYREWTRKIECTPISSPTTISAQQPSNSVTAVTDVVSVSSTKVTKEMDATATSVPTSTSAQLPTNSFPVVDSASSASSSSTNLTKVTEKVSVGAEPSLKNNSTKENSPTSPVIASSTTNLSTSSSPASDVTPVTSKSINAPISPTTTDPSDLAASATEINNDPSEGKDVEIAKKNQHVEATRTSKQRGGVKSSKNWGSAIKITGISAAVVLGVAVMMFVRRQQIMQRNF